MRKIQSCDSICSEFECFIGRSFLAVNSEVDRWFLTLAVRCTLATGEIARNHSTPGA